MIITVWDVADEIKRRCFLSAVEAVKASRGQIVLNCLLRERMMVV